ncbi:hypothetical protein Tco_0649020 [Tanacetum coccineum]
MSKLFYTHFTKLIIDYFLLCNKNISCRSNFELHSEGDDLPITKLPNTVEGKFKFGMEIPDTMIDDAFKKTAGYKYYKAKKVESEKARLLRNQKSRMCFPLEVEEEKVICVQEKMKLMFQSCSRKMLCQGKQDTYAEWGQKLKGSSVAHTKYYDNSKTDSDAILYSLCLDTSEESANEIDDADESDMDLTDDNPIRDDDVVGIEKAIQARVLTEIKKLLPTHIPKVIANYVRTRLNTSVLKVMQNNQISLFAKTSTSVDDLSDMDPKLKLLNKIHENKTHPTNQKLYDTLYDSILLDQEALDAQ